MAPQRVERAESPNLSWFAFTATPKSKTLELFGRPKASGAGAEQPYTESNLNPGLRGRSLQQACATDEFQIMLVANKFQTGFDQPLLSAMYVDKRCPA